MHRFAAVRRTAALLSAVVLFAAVPAAAQSTSGGDPAADINAVLQASAQAWNRGDLDQFLLPYLDAPTTTFIAGRVVRGVPAIRQTYATSWFRSGAPTQNLAYRDIEVRPLGPGFALAVGHFVLINKTTGAEEQSGIFSLTMQQTPQGWRIIHDHSS
jgi:uncharacterized protein (TIGR02246 family)